MNNQEIKKFRAWDIGKQKMYEPVCVMFCPEELRKYRIFTASDGEFLGNDKHFELMQYTGLKDKNGDKIYEKDWIYHPDIGDREVQSLIWCGMMLQWGVDFTKVELNGNVYEGKKSRNI